MAEGTDGRRADRFPSDAVALPASAGVAPAGLGDFEVSPRTLLLAALAAVLGALMTGVALALLRLIGLITHLAYTGVLATTLAEPDTRPLGPFSVLVPVAGGAVVGLMAKVGSERIRGHGIPEAMETIMLRGSRMEPRLAVLKPLSSAISIGTGGPFGAEGPIIVTGGAFGSIVGQLLHLTAAERRCLLVAGAAAGMTAVFGTPVAAVLLAVELLLFEWRPRSMIPVAAAAGAAAVGRQLLSEGGLLQAAPLFPIHAPATLPVAAALEALVVGLAGGLLAWLLTRCVYAAEDAFGRLRLHWAWWPALGGLVVGAGGLLDARALGVGYGTIGAILTGRLAVSALLALIVVKLVIWSISLGSNTSGGILAPVLMIGAAMGALLGALLPAAGAGTLALLGLAATLAGVTRSPFTSIVFGLELTHDIAATAALLIACTIAHATSVSLLRRSILTEKIARRGFHVVRDYEVDPLRALLAREVMDDRPTTIPAGATLREALEVALADPAAPALYPVVDPQGALRGVVRTAELVSAGGRSPAEGVLALTREDGCAHAEETLRTVADRMLAGAHEALPVLDREGRLAGMLTRADLMRARERVLIEERHRERPLADALRGTAIAGRRGRGAG